MTTKSDVAKIRIIPVDQIDVVNPRTRNQKIFQQIVDSISKVGLKRPITVFENEQRDHEAKKYKLICGQGRLEALVFLGQQKIPAIIKDTSDEDSLIMSLVENLARRRHQPLELLESIHELVRRGYSERDIADKIGLSRKYVQMIRLLLDEGEERLLSAVESGQIPISVAIDIAEADDGGVQEALAQAYQDGLLRGKKLLGAKRLVEQRRLRGRELQASGGQNKLRKRMSSSELVRAYEHEVEKQRLMIKKAEITQHRLLFIVEAIKQLSADENYLNLLRAEGLDTMPKPLANLSMVN